MTTIVRDLATFLKKPDDTILVYDMKYELVNYPHLLAEVLDYEHRVDEAGRDKPCELLGIEAARNLPIPPLTFPPAWLVPPPNTGAKPPNTFAKPELVAGNENELVELLCTKTSRNVAVAIAGCPLFAGHGGRLDGVFLAGGLPVALATGATAFGDADWFIQCRSQKSATRVRNEWVGWVASVVQTEVDVAVDAYVAEDREEREFNPYENVAAAGEEPEYKTTTRGFLKDGQPFTTRIELRTTRRAINVSVITPVGTLDMQLVLDAQHRIASTLYGFDIKMCQVAYDGTELLLTPDFVRSLMRGYEVIEPAKDRGGRYSRRLLKYMMRYDMCALIPGWAPELLDDLTITSRSSHLALRRFVTELPGRGAAFAILYKGYGCLGKNMLIPIDQAGYDFDDGALTDKATDVTAGFLERKFPVPYTYGMDASPRRVCTSPWMDGVTLAYAINVLRDDAKLFLDPSFA